MTTGFTKAPYGGMTMNTGIAIGDQADAITRNQPHTGHNNVTGSHPDTQNRRIEPDSMSLSIIRNRNR
jgi:hypothetical protein